MTSLRSIAPDSSLVAALEKEVALMNQQKTTGKLPECKCGRI